MKCEECSELLVDYIHNELGPEVNGTVKEHISSCMKCSRELKEYTEIRMAAQGEALPEVSSEVLSKISKAAKGNLQQNKKAFWKKWSYSPILVPALTSAIVLSVWFYSGYDGVNMSPEVLSNRDAPSLKAPIEAMEVQSDNVGGIIEDNTEMEERIVVEQKSGSALNDNITEPSENPQTFSYEQPPHISDSPPSESQDQANLEFAEPKRSKQMAFPQTQDAKPLAKSKSEASPKQNVFMDSFEQEESESANLRMQNDKPLVAQKKKGDECDVSITTNEAIVNSTIPVSKAVQKESYKTLAECYEQKRDFDRAISNYMNLQQVAPEESSFANTRIQDIRNRIRLGQIRKERMSDPVPTN
ncbi:MAG: hypothetical protein DHS20C13_24020 [Thermodesulfobacteriota bacterium]|nr:MAG: hypothetical protein DHS20C13_24020 [Thermodesulfobacteriota bacterium]